MSNLTNNTVSLQSILDVINTLPDAAGGIELPELTNEGAASDLLSGKELIDGEGNVVTGTIETKTASDLTTSGATVTVPVGYYASQATKSVTTITQATPSVSIDSNGLITASATQSAGYVNAGTKSGTKQLTTQTAKTITPTKSSQTAVSSGVYTTGTVTVAAIPSQYITTTDATAEASEIMSGETAYVNGSKVTGTFTLDNEIATQDNLIAQIQSAVDSLPDASENEFVLQNKTVTPSTNSQTITADSGYDGLETVTVNAIPSTYVKPTLTKAATTYTPTTTNQTIVAGTYCSGAQTIKGDSNLVAENIKSGVSIFNITGSYEGSGSGSSSVGVCPQLTIRSSEGTVIGICFYSTNNTYKKANDDGNCVTELVINDVDINTPVVIEVIDNLGMWDGMTGDNAIQLGYQMSILLAQCTSAGSNSIIQLIEFGL